MAEARNAAAPIIYASNDECLAGALELAEHLGTRAVVGQPGDAEPSGDASDELALVFDSEGLALVKGKLVLRADLAQMIPRLKPSNLHRELLVKAAKLKGANLAPGQRPLAVDATAGFGEDSLLLAAAGYTVVLYERDPVIAALLADALRRASENPELASVVTHMRLCEGDSVAGLAQLAATSADAPDLVFLDPMFPERTKSAAVKKKFQLIHHLERPCDDEDALVGAALAANPRKIVIKRAIKSPYLGGVKPAYSISGKAVRYDCIVPPRPADASEPRA